MLECAAALYDRFVAQGFGEFDVARMVDVIGSLTRPQARTRTKAKASKKKT
jgi:hypothetical protein